MASEISVEVVYVALDGAVFLARATVREKSTVREVIVASNILNMCREVDLNVNHVGIFSKRKKLDDVCHDGDRVEIYRPLVIDPKEARRQRAMKKD